MVDTGSMRKGITILIDGELYKIMEYNHVKQGRGTAFVRLTLRNVRTGSTIVKTVMAGERFEQARLENRKVTFLYRDGDQFNFMDQETYDQPAVGVDIIGDAAKYLREGQELELLFYGSEVLDVALPSAVELAITDTEPNYKGDTSSGGKPATLETGAVTTVPFFVNRGERIRVDTRTGAYIERVG
ncbi:MAG: Translation elongation factor P [uncultured Chloroflexia bacterium]|uniref:Elongation factor P n=1 Tax=uncultured Chloroflexia bacterium TaxID=1672391 RepID=A0A6J4H8E1_9CHLR|nr:MAG: Translation elongation factor P [uncultured Chloroflexia bacterium]